MVVKPKDVRRVDLCDAAETHLLEWALGCGGVVVFDRMALERRIVEVVALLAAIDDALLPPIIFVYEQARRARTDAQEGFARKPGALFTARLKQAPWWEAVRRQAAVRVGPRLIKA